MEQNVFNKLRPEVRGQRIVEEAQALVRLAILNLEQLYEPIKEFGTSPLRVFFFLYVSGTSASAEEIARFTKMPSRSVRDGLKQCRDRGYVEADPIRSGLWWVAARFRRNI